MEMIRTQEEIMQRFEDDESKDFFGTQRSDLIDFMSFENAKPHLQEGFVEKVEAGEKKWLPST